ncbi:MAG: hypothetical protein LBU58_04560 [Clostridiales bacterium]|jgi:hypothetical protein|nr:hypothetical protein [Clostridiales bacterium]
MKRRGKTQAPCGLTLRNPVRRGSAAKKSALRAAVSDERGSVTLESAFVVPIVIFTVCLSLYIVILLFERSQLQCASDYAAQTASVAWRGVTASSGSDGAQAEPADGAGLYYRLFDMVGAAQKEAVASTLAERRSQTLGLPGYSEARGGAEFHSGLLGRTLSVALHSVVTLPSERVMKAFGASNQFSAAINAKSLIPDAPDFIRNLDYVMEVEKKLEESSEAFNKVANGYRGLVDKIRGYIGGIL